MRLDRVARVIAPGNISYCRCCVAIKRGTIHRVKYWEVIADNLSKTGWNRRCVSAADSRGRAIFVADAHCSDNRPFTVLSLTIRALSPGAAG